MDPRLGLPGAVHCLRAELRFGGRYPEGSCRASRAAIYRVFLRNGTLDLRFNGEGLSYEEPRTTKDASCSSADQGGGKRRSGNSALV